MKFVYKYKDLDGSAVQVIIPVSNRSCTTAILYESTDQITHTAQARLGWPLPTLCNITSAGKCGCKRERDHATACDKVPMQSPSTVGYVQRVDSRYVPSQTV